MNLEGNIIFTSLAIPFLCNSAKKTKNNLAYSTVWVFSPLLRFFLVDFLLGQSVNSRKRSCK